MKRLIVLFSIAANFSWGQGVITTVAGRDWSLPAWSYPDGNAPLGWTNGVTVDKAGNCYFVDQQNHVIFKRLPDGSLKVIAGNGIPAYSGDGGPAANASISVGIIGYQEYDEYNLAGGLAVDNDGNLYIADSWANRVRKISPGGIMTKVAGTVPAGFSGDGGPATSATLDLPIAVAVDASGNVYISDTHNNRIRRVAPDGTIATFAGGGNSTADGIPALQASLATPTGLAVDRSGNLYIAEYGAGKIRKITPGGTITTVAGNGTNGGYLIGDGGKATSAQLYKPAGVAVDASGNLYIADSWNHAIRVVTPDGVIHTVAGNSYSGLAGDGGLATNAKLHGPTSVGVSQSGDLFIADSINKRIRIVTAGVIRTAAGNGNFSFSGDGNAATSATFNGPQDLVFDGAGNLLIADTGNNRIRRIDKNGVVSTIAGTGDSEFYGDGGPAIAAAINAPYGLALDSGSNIYIADEGNCVVRKINSAGTISTIAGDWLLCGSENAYRSGPALSAHLVDPVSVAADNAGIVYISDKGAHLVTKVTNGRIAPFAGNGTRGYSGDGGPASGAQLVAPMGISFDTLGNLFIADGATCVIRKVSAAGTISSVVGSQDTPCDTTGDGGQAALAGLSYPYGVFADALGNLFIPEYSDKIRRVNAAGVISTVAGNGDFDFYGDGGLATDAALGIPEGVKADAKGNLFIADTTNNRIREVLASNPAITVSPAALSFAGESFGAPAPVQSFSVASVPGLAFTVSVATSTAGWLTVAQTSGTAPLLVDVTADPGKLDPGSYKGTITLTAPYGNPASIKLDVTFTVSNRKPATLAVDTPNLTFSLPRSGSAQSQGLSILNRGSGTLTFSTTVGVVSPAGGKWLSVNPGSGQATAANPSTLTVTADPSGLAPGTYTARITITAAGANTIAIPVTMTISALSQAILLSQRGLSFTGVAQGGVVPPQTFAVQNIGTGVVQWTISTPALTEPVGWLQVTPASGSSDAALAPPAVTVTVNAAGLAPGIHYGLVQVNAPSAANSPQMVTIFLLVLPAGTSTGAVVDPGSMLFTAVKGNGNPGSQNVLVYNISASAKSFRSTVSSDNGLPLAILPTDATLDPQHPTQVVVQPILGALSPGVYTATLTLQFSDGRVRRVNIKVILASSGGGSSGSAARQKTMPDASGCVPTKLLPALISVADSFELPAGLPIKLGVYVKDDCGNAIQGGSVKATFSNGDNPATLQSLGGGLWEGEWLSQAGSLTQVGVKLRAENAGLSGEQQVAGNLGDLQQPPQFGQDGIVSAFGASAFAPISPGSVITIYGSELAKDSSVAAGIPWPTQWSGTQAFISGGNNVLLPLPLNYVSPGQVNAMVPYGVSVNTPLQVVIQRGFTLSQPVSVNLSAAEPVVYSGPGAVTAYPPSGGGYHEVTASAPAHVGDTLVFYAVGLGDVSPPVKDGDVPSALTNTKNPALVQIGNQTVTRRSPV